MPQAKTDVPEQVGWGYFILFAVLCGLLVFLIGKLEGPSHRQPPRGWEDASPDVRTMALTPVSYEEKLELEHQTRNVVVRPLPNLVHGPAFNTESARIEVITNANYKTHPPFRLTGEEIVVATGLLEEFAQKQPLQAFFLDNRYPMLSFRITVAKQPVRQLVFPGEYGNYLPQGMGESGIENSQVAIGILGEAHRELEHEEFFLWKGFEELWWEIESFEPKLYVGGWLERHSEQEVFFSMLCSLTLEIRPTAATLKQLQHPVGDRFGLSHQAAEGYAGGAVCASEGLALADATSRTPVTYAEYSYAVRQADRESEVTALPVSEASYEEYSSRLGS